MKMTALEKDILRVTLMESIDTLRNDPKAKATPKLTEAFTLAIAARKELLEKITAEPVVVY